jgi:hypothetical protein
MAPIRKLKLGEREPNDWAERSIEERLEAVWTLTKAAYEFKLGSPIDARLPRHVARVIRRRR